MVRPAECSSQRGLLLVEAVLSAVVIAAGLVFISRGLTSQLKALRAIDEYETLRSLAHGKLLELEAERLSGTPPTEERAGGSFGIPSETASGTAYQWKVVAVRRAELDTDSYGQPLFSEVTLTVRQAPPPNDVVGGQAGADRSPTVTLSAIWPTDWIPAEWFQ